MEIKQKINLDFGRDTMPITVFAKQNDNKTRFLEITPLNSGQSYALEEGITPRLQLTKSDGHTVFNDAKIENGKLYFEKRKDRPTPAEDFEIKLCKEINSISEVNAQIIIGNSQKPINIYKKSILLYFDSDKIFGELTARNRRAGDKILVRGMNRSVKKLLCDKKIPLDIRYRLPVICDAHGIVAVPLCAERDGVSLAKVKDKTRALCVRIDLL